MRKRVVFITGTDTGIGKTLLTGLLLAHARDEGINALATKPFCSGGRADLELLNALQDDALEPGPLNPFYYPEPVAPIVSARKHGRPVKLPEAVKAVEALASQCDLLLVEGSGGLLVPLGEGTKPGRGTKLGGPAQAKKRSGPVAGAYGWFVRDLIVALGAEVIVVSRNRLGTINHTLLTAQALVAAGVRAFKTVLMDNPGHGDVSRRTNAALLRELLAPQPLFVLPWLRGNCQSPTIVRRHARRQAGIFKGILAEERAA